jgi:hypothetical protein
MREIGPCVRCRLYKTGVSHYPFASNASLHVASAMRTIPA